MDVYTCPFIGSWCSLAGERWTTCWVTMRVPGPNILVDGHRPLFARGGTSITMCRPAVRVQGHAGGEGGCTGPAFSPALFLLGGGVGAAKGPPLFPGPQGEPAHGLHPRFVVAVIWADWGGGGGGGGAAQGGGVRALLWMPE